MDRRYPKETDDRIGDVQQSIRVEAEVVYY
jgi:hypothetical protein